VYFAAIGDRNEIQDYYIILGSNMSQLSHKKEEIIHFAYSEEFTS
jgi:hypothetical protein